jgi:GNAT superfamily N-acetyltransferase
VPREVVERSIDNSLNFGLFDPSGSQIGFARMVTDRAAFGYLADVFVLEHERGHGLGRWLIETVLAHPDLQGLRRITLGTKDAHTLYESYGFKAADSSRLMTLERSAEELYGPEHGAGSLRSPDT